jgi:protein-S-isoprenylcysteine O-methyltransferase Ste14
MVGRALEAEMQEQQTKHGQKFGAAELQSLVSLGVTLVIMAAALFWPAGTLAWTRGWIFLGLFLALTLICIAWIWRTNPELFAARRKFQKGTKAWDAIVATLTLILFAAILPVAALDDGRFHWAPQPDWVVWLGYMLMTAGYLGTAWAQSVNRHFEPTVRIQTDRGHKVIDTGPYAVIRHPGYAAALVMVAGIALSLGSLYALIPAGVLVVLLAGRTLGEEAELRKGLAGYTDYTTRVRWRWIPGVW